VKSLGMLLMAVISGLVAASASLAVGYGIWLALLHYLMAGMATTFALAAVHLWRAWEAERHPASRGTLQTAAPNGLK
jgi:hypothetical protein